MTDPESALVVFYLFQVTCRNGDLLCKHRLRQIKALPEKVNSGPGEDFPELFGNLHFFACRIFQRVIGRMFTRSALWKTVYWQ